MKQKQQKIIILCKYWLIANYKRELWLKTFKIRVIQICAITQSYKSYKSNENNCLNKKIYIFLYKQHKIINNNIVLLF